MDIRAFRDSDLQPVIDLWHDCGLVRPWNDPAADIALCRATASSELFVGEVAGDGARVRGVVMAGSDGHRGWLYYLAVGPELQGRGYARRLVERAEAWLGEQGVPKVELMIREDNTAVRAFYERIGYQVEPRLLMVRWIAGDGR